MCISIPGSSSVSSVCRGSHLILPFQPSVFHCHQIFGDAIYPVFHSPSAAPFLQYFFRSFFVPSTIPLFYFGLTVSSPFCSKLLSCPVLCPDSFIPSLASPARLRSSQHVLPLELEVRDSLQIVAQSNRTVFAGARYPYLSTSEVCRLYLSTRI